MKETKLYPEIHSFPPGISDLITPVSIYLKIRDKYPNAILLESSDYHGDKNSMTYICFDETSSFKVSNGSIRILNADKSEEHLSIKNELDLPNTLQEYISSFKIQSDDQSLLKKANGLFGYTSFDAVQYFDTIRFQSKNNIERQIPDVYYSVFRFIIGINHFNHQMYILENLQEGEISSYRELTTLLSNRSTPSFSFNPINGESTNMSDDEFKLLVSKGKKHCHLGDVFQIVLSRQFAQEFSGDEFNVYRSLRSINPSPYLFYFDYGGYKLFGSSPEAQIIIEGDMARINPIAGTFKRTGNDEKDKQLAIDLTNDPKENAEHVMLVDLARNDLSRNSDHVAVKTYREVQYYSHVIHLVSEVTGTLDKPYNAVQVFGDCFPAGTLSGAPKYKAMELIDKYENTSRGFYGGALGYFGFNGEVNHAIMIRSFLSKNNKLYYQAGAGVVSESNEENELNEVNNKLGALKKAIKLAEQM
jgi:anthranilate synthase component 1